MKSYRCLAMIWMCITLFGVNSRGADPDPVLEPAYLEQTNGLFAVCAFDRATGKLLRYKGVYISREQLPAVSAMRPNLIFAAQDTRPANTNRADSWKPQREELYNYGPVPYPIEDIDPPVELCKTESSELALGVRLRDRFYAFSVFKSPVDIQKVNRPILDAKSRLLVLPVPQPDHRGDEIGTVLDSLRFGE